MSTPTHRSAAGAPAEAAVVSASAAGLLIRPYRGRSDHPAMNRVAAAVRADNGEPHLGTVEDMDNYYAHLEHADLPRDCALVELDGHAVAYVRSSWEELASGDGIVSCVAFVVPDFRGRGVEELVLDHLLARAEEIIGDRAGQRGSRLLLFVPGRHGELRAAAEKIGFRPVRRDASLVRPDLEDIPEIPLPAGFEVRPIERDDRAMHRRVYDADARAFAESWGQEAPSEEGFRQFIEGPRFDPTLWRVAFHGDAIAGQILSFMDDPDADGTRTGLTEAISVQPEFRRRGLARALLAESLRAVRAAGATRAALGVDLQNPNQARALYESLGFRIVSEGFEYQLGPFPPGPALRLPRLAAP